MSVTIDIGHFARIPEHVAHARVPERAKGVWRELAFLSSPEKPKVWVRQQTLADKLGCSVDTVYRSLRALVKAGLLIATDLWHQGRHKIYELVWSLSQKILPTSRKSAEGPTAKLPEDVPQKCGPLIRVEEQTSEQSLASPEKEAEKLNIGFLMVHSKTWQQKFACLDGCSGRPTLQECIEQALNHTSESKYKDKVKYIEMWLTNAAGRWWPSYNREQNAPSTDFGLSKEALALKLREEAQRRRDWEKRRAEWDKKELERLVAKG